MTEQTVVEEADGQGIPAPETQDAQDQSLEELLAEFEGETIPEPTKTDEAPDPMKRIEELEQNLAREKTEQEISGLVSRIKGEDDIDPVLIRGVLNAKADSDPNLLKAFENKNTNPKAWKQVEGKLAEDIRSMLGPRIDQRVTEDVAAITAAVRGSSTKAPDPTTPNYSAMSDAEFEAEKRKQFTS